MQDGDPEDAHHRVADELLDRSPVPFEHVAGPVEVAEHDAPHLLGVLLLAQPGRSGHVAEEHGDRLADLELGSVVRVELPPAGEAEPGVFRVLLAATGACGHPVSVRLVR